MPLLSLALFDVLAEIAVLAVLKKDVEGVFVIPWLEVLNDPHNILILDLLQLQGLRYQVALQLQAKIAQVADLQHLFLFPLEVHHEVDLCLSSLTDPPDDLILRRLEVYHLVPHKL